MNTNPDSSPTEALSRRDMLKFATAAAGGGLLFAASTAATQAQDVTGGISSSSAAPQGNQADAPKGTGANTPGPKNPPLDALNRDSAVAPMTDHGDVNVFKYSFALAHKKATDAGWARQVTVRDLPISKDIAGVNMRLLRGGVRELHWHQAAEWSFMLYGNARLTAIDAEGRSYVQDVKAGDTWNFPSGIPHSIQGLEPDGCEFLLVFDDGEFSEYETFLISEFMARTPKEVLAKNFGVKPEAFKNIPKEELYIFNAPLPGDLAAEKREAAGPRGPSPIAFEHRLAEAKPNKVTRGGEVRISDSNTFKASLTISAALVTLKPGGLRELHWHPQSDEWQYYVSGQGRMTVFAAGNRARTMDFQAGDVGYVLRSMGHYIENTGDTDLVFLEMFKSNFYQDISFNDWVTHTPRALVTAHTKLDNATLDAVPKEKFINLPV